MTILMIVLAVLIVIGFLYFSFPIVEVVGISMHPTYQDKEFILGTRLFRKSSLKCGDVVVYKSPTDDKVVIKRITQVSSVIATNYYEFFCEGDNYDYSYDSRYYGFIPDKNIICKIIKPRENKKIQEEGGNTDE